MVSTPGLNLSPVPCLLALALVFSLVSAFHAKAATIGADAVVLVNSTSARYPDFQRYIQPYLDNFAIAYTVLDLASNGPGTNVAGYGVIIVGHRQLDTNHVQLDTLGQFNISQAVSNGTGLVNFDSDLSLAGGAPRYQFVQDIFGFAYGPTAAVSTVLFPATEPGSQMHYITSLHQTNETMALTNSMTLAGVTLSSNGTALASSGGHVFLAVRKYGQGCAVQWTSYDWMSPTVLGPINGLDDLVWRGIVWAARKPFVMRALPNFVTMRIDDVAGPFSWAHIANDVGFKPFLGAFISDVSRTNAADLRGMVTNGNATASVHSFTGSSFFFWNHAGVTNWPDNVISNNFYAGTQWHASNGIPMSKVIVAHYSEISPNAFPWLKTWGIQFSTVKNPPGTRRDSPWLVAGPYRLYGPQQLGSIFLPVSYADFLTIPGHPELDGQFFNCVTEVRDVFAPTDYNCGEWCPDNNVAATTGRGTRALKRALDSCVLATLFSHEWYIHSTPSVVNNNPISDNNWRAIVQGITNNLAAYNPIFVTLDYACQYVRATRTSRLTSSQFDPSSGQLNLSLSGKTDLDISVQIFLGYDSRITNLVASIAAFPASTNVTVQVMTVPPFIVTPPSSRTNDAGTTASFVVGGGGTSPLSYQWFRDETNGLSDGGNISGAATTTLTLSNVLGADAAGYSVVISNGSGSVTSSPVMLTVKDPVIVMQPVSRTNHAGTDAIFRVGVNGTDPAYQWLKESSPAVGETNATLFLPAVSDLETGEYSVWVSNAYGSLLSSPATLTVGSPLVIQSISLSDGVAAIQWNSIPGNNYSLQYQDFLDDTNWAILPPVVTASGPIAGATNAVGNSTQRFYRVFLQP